MAAKKYTRKGLIRYFEKLPPWSRPCREDVCPIATFMGPGFVASYTKPEDASIAAEELDPFLAEEIDIIHGGNWDNLTAARIVKIAKAAPHV